MNKLSFSAQVMNVYVSITINNADANDEYVPFTQEDLDFLHSIKRRPRRRKAKNAGKKGKK